MPNAEQVDSDGDGIGDVCDDLCIGEVTTLASTHPAATRPGSNIELVGTGFGPSVEVQFGSSLVRATPENYSGRWLVRVPQHPSLTPGTHEVHVVNLEGCRSQEPVTITIQPPASGSCGLTGIEPFLLLGLLGGRRFASRPRRASSTCAGQSAGRAGISAARSDTPTSTRSRSSARSV